MEYTKLDNKENNIGFGHITSPEERANVFSKLFFWWANRLPFFAAKNVLQLEHLWQVAHVDRAEVVFQNINKPWQILKNSPKPSFARALWQSYKKYYFQAFFFMLVSVAAQMIQPELLAELITWISNKQNGVAVHAYAGYLYALGMFFVSVIGFLCTYQAQYLTVRAGSCARSAVTTSVYRKALKLSNGAKYKTNQGNIVNIMSTDAQSFVDSSGFLYFSISAPFQITASIILLYFKIGWPAFVALGVMTLFLPFNGFATKKLAPVRVKMSEHSDVRVKLTTEIIQNIKVIKLYAWEDSFAQKVIHAWMEVIKSLRQYNNLRACIVSVINAVPTIAALLMYTVYWISGKELNAAIVFSSLSYLLALSSPFNILPLVISFYVKLKVSITRITDFMLLEEISQVEELYDSTVPTVKINASFSWDVPKDEELKKEQQGQNSDFILRDIEMNFSGPRLIAIVGAVGSGKSSLCHSILGEMKLLKGNIGKRGSIAYVPQQAWIINATFRDNILFGSLYDEKKYNDVLEACALLPDLEILSSGDLTEIGERGINLSGGQKQRVSIARALYSDSDIYILDDPLSAVDAHVGKHLFYQCIRKFLQNKLVILATNQLQFLPNTDHVILLGKDGNIVAQGHCDQLMDSSDQFQDLMRLAGGGGLKPEEEHTIEEEEKKKVITSAKSVEEGKLVSEEQRKIGAVGLGVYINFIKSGGFVKGILILLISCSLVFTNSFLDWWLSHWTANQASSGRSNSFYLSVYICIGVFTVIVSAIKAFSLFQYMPTCSMRLHNTLFNNLIRAPMWYFDVTPLGRIQNRFSKDIEQVDMAWQTLDVSVTMALKLVASFVIISIAVPVVLAVIAPCIIIFAYIQKFYRHTSREIQRVEAISRSPIFSHFSETLAGTSSIRAYNCEERMVATNESLLNDNNRAYFTSQAMSQWLGVRLDFLSSIIMCCTAMFIIVFSGSVSSAESGLALAYALQLTSFVNQLTLYSSWCEARMNSIERILEFSSTPQEPQSLENNEDPKWPATGDIQFNNFKMRYRQGLDLVLKGISCHIHSKEKIGIVGRTGAGKSSVVLALFRLVEAAEGNINMDHKNIAEVSLKSLRSKIAIIPQDPVLFSGTLRENLDPFNSSHDAEIWRVLELAHLKDAVEKAGGLQALVVENGDNFSVGQRQLICLCRALLKKPTLLVLDEATASVDTHTDALLQKTIKTAFHEATILTIAHRLHTIMDSDRIIVMDKGEIAEFDTPAKLLANPHGHLTWLVDQTGPQNADVLRNIAYNLM